MRRRLPLQLCALFLLAACGAPGSQPPSGSEGTLAADRYRNDIVGWSMPVPPGWRVMSAAEIDALTGRGREILEDSVGQPIEMKQSELLYLSGSPQSVFTSTRKAYDPSDGAYADVQTAIFDTIEDAYSKTLTVVSIERGQEAIDDVDFATLSATLQPRGGGIELQQRWYTARIGNQCLTVSILAASDAERDAVLRAWRASSFDAAKNRRAD